MKKLEEQKYGYKKNIKNLFEIFKGTHIAICIDQHRTTGITLELYTRYRDNYKNIAYFEGDTIAKVVKKAFKHMEQSLEDTPSNFRKTQWLSFKRSHIEEVGKELGIESSTLDALISRLS